jgi:hypothetical protein
MWELHFRAQAGNITIETLLQWRKQDAEFDQLLQTDRLKAVEQRWKRIEKAAKVTEEYPPDWKADAWSLQRTYPQFFGRPVARAISSAFQIALANGSNRKPQGQDSNTQSEIRESGDRVEGVRRFQAGATSSCRSA